eukprot:120861-Chlamydomonas_euryale.AAC.1
MAARDCTNVLLISNIIIDGQGIPPLSPPSCAATGDAMSVNTTFASVWHADTFLGGFVSGLATLITRGWIACGSTIELRSSIATVTLDADSVPSLRCTSPPPSPPSPPPRPPPLSPAERVAVVVTLPAPNWKKTRCDPLTSGVESLPGWSGAACEPSAQAPYRVFDVSWDVQDALGYSFGLQHVRKALAERVPCGTLVNIGGQVDTLHAC